MLARFKKFIQYQQLFSNDEKILLTVSGGIDSMVMVDLFKKENYLFGIAHCNFGLRGAESNDDEEFVSNYCKTNEIPFFTIQFETEKFALENKISVQMAARQLRYHWFNEIALKNNYNYIATAHHQNDVAETMLINITRGTGISGLHGILAKKNKIIRPLLFTNKKEIIQFATENNIDFREDSSNKKEDYLRNNIRHNIVPKLEELNNDAIDNFYNLSLKIQTDEILINEYVNLLKSEFIEIKNNEIYISLKIMKHQAKNSLLYYYLKPYNFNENDIEQIVLNYEKNSGILFESKTHVALIDRDYIIIKTLEKSTFNYTIKLKEIENNSLKINEFSMSLITDIPTQFSNGFLYINIYNLNDKITIRNWQQGDKFKPLGMIGNKLLSDYFIDKKINQFEKEKCLVLYNETNHDIMAVLPFQISNDYKIDYKTKYVLKVELG